MDNSPNKKQQVHDLINTLRERSHVVEFAEKCAERAESYAAYAAYTAAADYAASATEHDIQITHLKELHAREQK